MTTLLSQQQTDALRSIGDSALVLFAMVMIDRNYPGRVTKPEELLPYLHPTYKDLRKLRTQLDALSASNRLAKNGAGYVLLEGGRALVLSMAPAQTAPAIAPLSESDKNDLTVIMSDASESDKLLAQSPDFSSGTLDQAQEFDARALRALKKEEEESTQIKKNNSTSTDFAKNARTTDPNQTGIEIADGVDTRRVLLATSMLEGFSEGVFLEGIDCDAIHPRMALGWIAQAYDQRETLSNPAGLVYKRLRDQGQPKPRAKYYEGWESYLPEAYLQNIGLMALICTACGETFETLEAFKEHDLYTMKCEQCGARFHKFETLEEHIQTHTPQVPTFERLSAETRGGRAWNTVREELRRDMPKASFETWVRDVEAVRFEASTLTLVVRNAYACDWLNDRLKAKIEAMLKTFMHEAVAVEFVVGVVEES